MADVQPTTEAPREECPGHRCGFPCDCPGPPPPGDEVALLNGWGPHGGLR